MATVDKNGKVKAVGNGKAVITITNSDGSVSKKITVKVNVKKKDVKVKTVKIKKPSKTTQLLCIRSVRITLESTVLLLLIRSSSSV